MAKRVQHVRHDTTGADAFTGLEGEFTYVTDTKEIRAHDGATLGGLRILNKTQLDNTYQTKSDELDALASLNDTPGMLAKIGNNAYAKRILQGTPNQIEIANGDGVADAPLFSLSATLVIQTSINVPTLIVNAIAEKNVDAGVQIDGVTLKDGVVAGDLVGDVTGNLIGNVQGDVVGDLKNADGTSEIRFNGQNIEIVTDSVVRAVVKQNGEITGIGGWEKIAEISASGQQFLTFLNSLDLTKYEAFEALFYHVTPGTGGADFFCQVTDDGGSTWLSTPLYKTAAEIDESTNDGPFDMGNNGGPSWQLADNVASVGLSGSLRIFISENSKRIHTVFSTTWDEHPATDLRTAHGGHRATYAGTLSGIRFYYFTSIQDTVQAGKIVLRGLRK